MITAEKLADVLPTLPQIQVDGVFWRTVSNRHLRSAPPGAPAGTAPQPLWPGGAAIHGARYTRLAGPNSLYLAADAATALAEVEAVVFGSSGEIQPGAAHDPLVVFSTRVHLPATVDLCDDRIVKALGTSESELKAPWLRAQERHKTGRGPLPPTQELGDAAFQTGTILGLRYPSYRHAGAQNLVIFTDLLAPLGGEVVLIDSSGTHVQSLP